jgi:hypothetical protein
MNWTDSSQSKMSKMLINTWKKCFPLAIKEMQIKTMLTFPLNPVRMAIMKETSTNAA